MTDQGDRAPREESAASIVGRTAAIDAAFAEFEFDDDDAMPSAAAQPELAEPPSGDDQAATPPQAEATAGESGESVPQSERPVEGQPVVSKSQDALDAPKHWPADRREQFQSLPDDAKRIILERNKEANVAVTKAQQEAAQYRRTSEAIASVFNDDHRAQMQRSGLDEIGAIQYLVRQHDALNSDPVGFLKAVIAQTGVKAEQLFGGQAPQQQPGVQPQPEATQEWRDPDVVKLEEKLAKIEAAEAARQQDIQRRQRDEAVKHQSWFNDQCVAFETAMDDDGNPKYPHLPAVMSDLIRLVKSDPAANALLQSDPQKALEQAYNQAVYLNPEVRQAIIDADLERRLAERDAQNSVKKAQAATTRKGSPGANGQSKVSTKMSREEAINKAMADFGI